MQERGWRTLIHKCMCSQQYFIVILLFLSRREKKLFLINSPEIWNWSEFKKRTAALVVLTAGDEAGAALALRWPFQEMLPYSHLFCIKKIFIIYTLAIFFPFLFLLVLSPFLCPSFPSFLSSSHLFLLGVCVLGGGRGYNTTK